MIFYNILRYFHVREKWTGRDSNPRLPRRRFILHRFSNLPGIDPYKSGYFVVHFIGGYYCAIRHLIQRRGCVVSVEDRSKLVLFHNCQGQQVYLGGRRQKVEVGYRGQGSCPCDELVESNSLLDGNVI